MQKNLRAAVNELKSLYRDPVETRRGNTVLLVFKARNHYDENTPYEFRVIFRQETAACFVNGIKFIFECPAPLMAADAFTQWPRIDREEPGTWLRNPSYLSMVSEEESIDPRYFTALARIILAAFFATAKKRILTRGER